MGEGENGNVNAGVGQNKDSIENRRLEKGEKGRRMTEIMRKKNPRGFFFFLLYSKKVRRERNGERKRKKDLIKKITHKRQLDKPQNLERKNSKQKPNHSRHKLQKRDSTDKDRYKLQSNGRE